MGWLTSICIKKQQQLRKFPKKGSPRPQNRSSHRVVLEHVGHVVGGDEGVVDGNHLDVVPLDAGTHHQAPDATKAVDANLDLFTLRGDSRHGLIAKGSFDGGGARGASPV